MDRQNLIQRLVASKLQAGNARVKCVICLGAADRVSPRPAVPQAKK